MSSLPEGPGLPGHLAPGIWPLALAPGGPTLPALPVVQLTTCSWEQNDTIVKVYVPLRGVQTDMLRPVFTPTSAEVGSLGSPLHLPPSPCSPDHVRAAERPPD